jgi:hypothetical protein
MLQVTGPARCRRCVIEGVEVASPDPVWQGEG